MNCINEDTWVTIGDYEWGAHEGRLWVKPNTFHEKEQWWQNLIKFSDYDIISSFSELKFNKDGTPYHTNSKPCLGYSNVDDWTDLANALSYFHECGLYIKLSAKDLSKLVEFIGLSFVEMPYDFREKGFDRFKFIKDYGKFRFYVLKRDNHKCVCCGADSELEVHHIYSFRNYLELGTTVSNGITLCKNCHSKYHEIYKYNSNPVNFMKFIKDFGVVRK